MKKSLFILISFILIVVYFLVFYIFTPISNPYVKTDVSVSTDFLRLHIRANSNTQSDQETKYQVRDSILPLIMSATETSSTTKEATIAVFNISSEIEKIASEISGTTATVEITTEQFPTRQYDGEILPVGDYSAVVINIGEAEGDNWWCVAFPPLCYIDGEEIEGDEIILQSKILEILDKYKKDC